MKNEFILAFNEVLEEKGLPREVVLDALQAALASAYRRHVNASNAQQVDAIIDPETGGVTIYAEKEVVETVEDPRTEVSLQEATKVNSEAEIGSMVIVESTPNNFGRVAAQTARQVIQQRMREAEREVQFDHYSKQVGEIMSGVVQAINNQGVTLGLEMKAEGIMPRSHQIPGERFRVHDRVRALLLEVKITPRGPQIVLSRAHRNFLRRLLENEVPEIYHGMVEIRSIAREPGQRSKVAVSALQAGVDPVGACVGIRGVRIQAIVRELNDEKIDVIEWNQDPAAYIAKALSPARVTGVYLNEANKNTKTATVVVPEDQLSLAIGRDGQNARLAAKLTSWRIDIKSLPEAATDALYKLQNDPEYLKIASQEMEIVSQVENILGKKAEGRPVTPEEYQQLTQFVDRVERGYMRQLHEEKLEEEKLELITRANIPALAFEIPLPEFEVSDRLYAVISETGFQTVGDLMMQLRLDPDSIWRLNGMGPNAMAELEEALARIATRAAEAEAAEAGAEEVVAEQELAEAEPAAEAIALEVEEAPAEALEVAPQALEEQLQPGVTEEPLAELAAPPAEPEAAPEEQLEEPAALEAEPEAVLEVEELVAEPDSLAEIFALTPEALDFEQVDDEELEDEEDSDSKQKQKKKKKKRYVEIEYDPEQDVMLVKKKRKREGLDEWEEEW
ncbi:MAG: transcription termination/antitermination protein NusA [Anaerolineales bacterium]|nr:transcription termination/antitermination protein NusA [Anaerolineales bacterium]